MAAKNWDGKIVDGNLLKLWEQKSRKVSRKVDERRKSFERIFFHFPFLPSVSLFAGWTVKIGKFFSFFFSFPHHHWTLVWVTVSPIHARLSLMKIYYLCVRFFMKNIFCCSRWQSDEIDNKTQLKNNMKRLVKRNFLLLFFCISLMEFFCFFWWSFLHADDASTDRHFYKSFDN